jgi:hypothetical protein
VVNGGGGPGVERLEEPDDDDRQRYGRLLDSARMRGLIDDEEYSRRLTELGEASTEAEMREMVARLPAMRAGAGADATAPASGLDPVDLARLMKRSGRDQGQNRRWAALVAIALMFLVLIVLGIVLAMSVHSRSGDGAPFAGYLSSYRSVLVGI